MADQSNFRDAGTAGELEVQDKTTLLEWFANEYKKFGCTLEFVTNKSHERSQFCRGFGGIGGIVRYQLDIRSFDELSNDGELTTIESICQLECKCSYHLVKNARSMFVKNIPCLYLDRALYMLKSEEEEKKRKNHVVFLLVPLSLNNLSSFQEFCMKLFSLLFQEFCRSYGREDNYVHVSEAFMAGIAAGAVESVVSSPFELIKLRAQVNSASHILSSDTVTAKTAVSPLLARLLPGYSPDMRTLNHSVGLLFPETFEVAKTISMGPSLKSGSKVGKSGSKVHEPDEHPPQHIS
ncbi:hypothetical protein CsSME_00036283 [Camellia sinensis var. sinensis]